MGKIINISNKIEKESPVLAYLRAKDEKRAERVFNEYQKRMTSKDQCIKKSDKINSTI